MKILVTGANGFIGKNLCLELKNKGFEVLPFDVDKTEEDLKAFLGLADYIIHLAGINRPMSKEEFYNGNANFTFRLIELLKASNRIVPIIFSSSMQAELDNDYGKSKRMAEDYLLSFVEETGNPVIIYRLTNVFGKWCKPNYNSVVATFCYNIANNLPIEIRDENYDVRLVYVDDVVNEFIKRINEPLVASNKDIMAVYPIEVISLGRLAKNVRDFKKTRETFYTPNFESDFDRKLYATFLSYYSIDNFAYDLKMNVDNRGSFTEVIKTLVDGQVSVNISKPSIIKGNHYHHSKNEKFIVVSGECEIKFRKIGTKEVFAYKVNGEKIQAVDIPPGYTHSIKNVGNTDSVTIMWASEVFDKDNPDTYYEEVEIDE
ncbi:MAG: NAD-dependent epimerase/dehydratase family protein [Bacilli bacterium]|nr:NAD-dependent epimerase/dehydratase family protein [Bacilli bacterium]